MTVTTHPGYCWGVGPTHDWDRPAEGPFVWVAYRSLPNGMAERRMGFAETRQAAMELARANV